MFMTGQRREPHALWNPSFLIYLLGSTQSGLGSIISGIALSFVTLELTHSAGATGMTLALAMVPNLLGPFAGTLVDRRGAQLNGLSRVPGLAADLLQAREPRAQDLLRPLSQSRLLRR